MQTYQVKILPRDTFLYGGTGVAAPNIQPGAVLMVKNDRFGEPVAVKVVTQQPAHPPQTADIGVLERDQALTVSLQYVLRVEAKTLAVNLDSYVSCVIVQGQR